MGRQKTSDAGKDLIQDSSSAEPLPDFMDSRPPGGGPFEDQPWLLVKATNVARVWQVFPQEVIHSHFHKHIFTRKISVSTSIA